MLSKRGRRARTIATVLLSTLVFLASNVVAEAAPVDSSPVGESSDADRAAVAKELGISEEDALASLDFQGAVSAEALRLSTDPRVTSFWMESGRSPHLTIGVRPGTATEPLRASLPAQLRRATKFTEQRFSEEELAQIGAALNQSLTGGSTIHVDVQHQKVEVLATSDSGVEYAMTKVKAQRSADAWSDVVEVRVDRGLTAMPAVDIYGGRTSSGCTLGFTVRNTSTGTRGTTTAAHCGNSQATAGINLPFKFEWLTGSSDVQWHTASSGTLRNWVTDGTFDSTPYYRSITGTTARLSLVLGGTYCKFGATTGYGCGVLNSRTEPASWVPNSTPRYLAIDSSTTQFCIGGDSGGPVYAGAKGVGLVSGCTGNQKRLISMSMDGFGGLPIVVATS